MPPKPLVHADDSPPYPALMELCRNGRDEWREGLRLPRATRYLSRYERGQIAFPERLDSTALPLAA